MPAHGTHTMKAREIPWPIPSFSPLQAEPCPKNLPWKWESCLFLKDFKWPFFFLTALPLNSFLFSCVRVCHPVNQSGKQKLLFSEAQSRVSDFSPPFAGWTMRSRARGKSCLTLFWCPVHGSEVAGERCEWFGLSDTIWGSDNRQDK